jgi:hypothetical protein
MKEWERAERKRRYCTNPPPIGPQIMSQFRARQIVKKGMLASNTKNGDIFDSNHNYNDNNEDGDGKFVPVNSRKAVHQLQDGKKVKRNTHRHLEEVIVVF